MKTNTKPSTTPISTPISNPIASIDTASLDDVTGGCAACGGNCGRGAAMIGARAGAAVGQYLRGLTGR